MHLDSPVSLNVKINFTQQSGAKKMAKYVQKDITLEPYFKYLQTRPYFIQNDKNIKPMKQIYQVLYNTVT